MKQIIAAAFSLVSLLPAVAWAHPSHYHDAEITSEQGISIGGTADWQAAFLSEDLDEEKGEHTFRNDTEIFIQYRALSDYGFSYGGVFELEADVTEDEREEGFNADKTYIYVESGWGRVEMGASYDAAALLSVNAARFARATGGIHGDWELFATVPGDDHSGGGHSHAFIDSPSLPLHQMHDISEDANKITYISPRFSGFQFGASYIPDTGDGGQIRSGGGGHHDFNDVISAGVSYEGSFSDVLLRVALTGEKGNSEVAGHEDLRAWEAGANIGYKGFTIGGSYGDWDTSANHSTPAPADGNFWDVGGAYDYGRGGFSVTYLNSEYQRNELDNLVFGVDYYLAPGITPYAELSLFDYNHADPTIEDNDGSLLITGIQLHF